MPPRKTARHKEAQLAFESISIVGSLLSPDWLSRVAQLAAGHQGEADYRIPKGLNLRDEIGRYWRIANAHWAELNVGRTAVNADPRALAERFVLALFRECFGFASLAAIDPIMIAEHTYPIGFAAVGRRVPVIIAPFATKLDAPVPSFSDDGRRRSAFGLVQEYLNAADEAQWGIASDGVSLRIARDNASLTRPAWIEVDLVRMFAEERYSDFTALWLLAHETRFGRPDQPIEESALESWRKAGQEEGTRIRGKLEQAFEDAVLSLGQGFLAHPDNQRIRAELQDGTLSTKEYFNQLLRLVYRLIFLLTVEERGLLHPDATPDAVKRLYSEGYSLKRLRERCLKRSAHDRFGDLWEAMKIVYRGLAVSEPKLGLPALAGIFAMTQCPALDDARLENRALLTAVFRLAWLREPSGLTRVNWRDMGPEELGSVYETLLELVPHVAKDGRQFAFANAAESKGNARKTSGSYYTPDSLVQVLLDSALEPIIADRIATHPSDTVEALLGLSIVDPACGSGHFLLGAARRLATHVARRQVAGTPSIQEYQHALRQVVGRCIFGVDQNPMAVELCKVSLWMEAVEPGLPLTFLDSHIQQGNSLLGTTPGLMDQGIPDAAWDPIEGDDKKTASTLKKRNKAERIDKNTSFEFSAVAEGGTVAITTQVQALDASTDEQLRDVERKQDVWKALLASQQYRARWVAADAWCAAFVWPKPKIPDELTISAPTQQVWERLRHDPQTASPLLVDRVQEIAREYGFFHWYLAFPQVFAKGGFDVVLGNPPWERVKLQEQEFFASRDEEITNARNAAARKKRIADLPTTNPQLWGEWCKASRRAEGESQFIRASGRYPLCGRGDINTYSIFAEHGRAVRKPAGAVGIIVPTGIATDDTTKEFFQSLLVRDELRRLYDFQTGAETFGNLAHGAMRFCLLTLGAPRGQRGVDLCFLSKTPRDLVDKERHFFLTEDDFELLNPNTGTCPTFASRRDADINLAIYRRTGVLWNEKVVDGNPWGMRLMAMLHMANDSGLFRSRDELEADGWHLDGNQYVLGGARMQPLYEAKMIDHFDHRYASLIGVERGAGRASRKLVGWYAAIGEDPEEAAQPQSWVAQSEVEERLVGKWERGWLLGWRDICRSTDQRTVISSLTPRTATGDTFLLAMPAVETSLAACFYGNLCSFVLDYAARQKIGGTHLKFHVFRQLPVLHPTIYETDCAWSPGSSVRSWLLPRIMELTFTAWDMEPFARDVGYTGSPYRWNPSRRAMLRCELDAAFFRLYGIARDDVAYIMDAFPIVRRFDEEAHGEYQLKRVILEIFDDMAVAERTNRNYQTRLVPAPADPSVAHPPRVPRLPAMPVVIPQSSPAEDAALTIWALLRAAGGTLTRIELARAFALRSKPSLLTRFAPSSLTEAGAWASKVAARSVPQGMLATTLRILSERDGIALAIDSQSRSTVSATQTTPSEGQLDPWFRFEAHLALLVLRAQPDSAFQVIDESLTGDDRSVLERVS